METAQNFHKYLVPLIIYLVLISLIFLMIIYYLASAATVGFHDALSTIDSQVRYEDLGVGPRARSPVSQFQS
jgi:hypothetical protein